MQNTFNDLSNKDQGFPEVEVLLATYNGELYISKFLDSLSLQNDVRIHLRVSDDGSSDRTLEIVDSYRHLFESCKVFNGPCNGPSANFFSLIKKATFEFVALADQDDIWLPHHLTTAVKRLSETPEFPALTFSAVEEFNDKNETVALWPKRFPGQDIRTIICENLARGCTFVLNSKAINLIKIHTPTNAIMHDWWILLLIFSSGCVTWSELPEVKYRIHQNNAVGATPSFFTRILRLRKTSTLTNWPVFNQAEELISLFSWSMAGRSRHEIGSFVRDLNSHFLTGRWVLLASNLRFRTNPLDEILIRLRILLHKRSRRGTGSMGIFLYHRFRQSIAFSTFFVFSFRSLIRTFINYKISRNFYKIQIKKNLNLVTSKRVAIVALYPRRDVLSSATRLIDSLTASDYSVMVVMNESEFSGEWISELESKPVGILLRPNIGRDFGAYKVGFEYLKKLGYLEGINYLAFANDSVYYGPRSIDFVNQILKSETPWNCMFVNYQFHTHGQSFFQVFNKEIFSTLEFSNFWEDYYPSELRHQVINHGEVGLSNICLGLGFAPDSYITPDLVLNHPNFGDFTQDEKFGIWSNHGLAFYDSRITSKENTIFLMRRQHLENNITHHQGLLASRVLGAPIKLDIFKTGQVTIEAIQHTLMKIGCSSVETKTVALMMSAQGSHASRKGIKRLWASYGLV